MKKSVYVLAFLSAAALLGCASSGTHATTEPLVDKLSGYQEVKVIVESQVTEAQSQIPTIREQVLSKLDFHFRGTPLTEGAKSKGALGVRLNVTEFNAVGGAAHLFLGPLAGADRVVVSGTFFDIGTGRKLGTFTSKGEARLGGIVVGNTGTVRASAQLGEEIVALVKDNQ